MTTRDPFILRAEELGRRLGAAEWDLLVAEVELEVIQAEAVKLGQRRDAARELVADAGERFRAAMHEFFTLKHDRDAFDAKVDEDERAAIESEAAE